MFKEVMDTNTFLFLYAVCNIALSCIGATMLVNKVNRLYSEADNKSEKHYSGNRFNRTAKPAKPVTQIGKPPAPSVCNQKKQRNGNAPMKHFKCTENLNNILSKDSIWQLSQASVIPYILGEVILLRNEESGNIMSIKIPEDIFDIYFEEVKA